MSSFASHRPLLEVVLLPLLPLCIALADNALTEPLRREAIIQLLKVLHNVPAATDDGILGCDGTVSLDAELESRKERMRNFVGGKDDVLVLEEALGEQVTKRVVFLVEGEDRSVRNACCAGESVWAG